MNAWHVLSFQVPAWSPRLDIYPARNPGSCALRAGATDNLVRGTRLVIRQPRRTVILLCSLFLSWSASLEALEAQPSDRQAVLERALAAVSKERLLNDIATLSDATFNGRQTGSRDDLRSAEWVRERFRSIFDDHASLQDISGKNASSEPLLSRSVQVSTIAADPTLELRTASHIQPAGLGTDYLPVMDTPAADLHAPIAFVGYGIVDPASGLDEYEGIDVRDHVVFFLRGKPERLTRPVSHAEKVRMAKAKGAIGYLTATGPILTAYEARRGVTGLPSAMYGLTEDGATLPGAWISTDLAYRILDDQESHAHSSLREAQDTINRTLRPHSRMTGTTVRLAWRTDRTIGVLYTVPARFPTGDAEIEADTLIIGAHRDHFGTQAGLLFPGADDNASGTAVLLEVARALKQTGAQLRRPLLFLSFSGEEQGLLGSRFYVEHPLAPLKEIKAMINVDHVGVGNGRLTVGLTGLEKTVAMEAGRATGLSDKLDLYGFFPGGDHVPFKEAGVATATVVSAGVHPQFHQPSDRVETLDVEILVMATRYVLGLVWELANAP